MCDVIQMKVNQCTSFFVLVSMQQHGVKVSLQTEAACDRIAHELNIPQRYKNQIPYSSLLEQLPVLYGQYISMSHAVQQKQLQIDANTKLIIEQQQTIEKLKQTVKTFKRTLKDTKEKWVPLKPRKPWKELSRDGKRARKKRMVHILQNLLPLLSDVMSEYSLDSITGSFFHLLVTSKAGRQMIQTIKGNILYKMQKQVTPAVIVALKDAARVSDRVYSMFRQLIPQVLPSTYAMKEKRATINDLIWSYLPEVTYTGVEIDARLFLVQALPHYYSIEAGMTIEVFGSVDALQLNSVYPQPVTLMGFKFPNMNKPENCFATAIWEGKDTRYLIEKNAPRYIHFMKDLVEKKGLFTVGGVQITLVFCFVADMAALWAILGHQDCLYCDISLNDYMVKVGSYGELKQLDEVWQQ